MNRKFINFKAVKIMSKIDKSLEEYKNWCSSLGILCADDINRAIAQG
ncbi:MAG: hypothetical protein L6V93_07830 [Clostridiales bacterium]|nr:MAG: hypothetical protein L6V93_07830 [Clostridiales bacterium]